MFYEIKLAAQLVRKEGLAPVIRRMGRYICKWPRYLLFPFKATRLRSVRNMDLPAWVDFAFTGYNGLISPLQIRSEIIQLLIILQSRPPKYILEIGTSNGGTLFLISRVAQANASIISIDLPLAAFGGGYPAWKRPFYQSFAVKNQKIHLIRADSHDPATRKKVSAILQTHQIDLLFIDGDHTYEGVKKDFEMYEPLVKAGGAILLHDIVPHNREDSCGVGKYWGEIKKNHQHQEFVENPDQGWGGLGMITKQSCNI